MDESVIGVIEYDKQVIGVISIYESGDWCDRIDE